MIDDSDFLLSSVANEMSVLSSEKREVLIMTSFEDLRDNFMRMLMLENRSKYSVLGVRSPLNIFFRFIRSIGINDIRKITKENIRKYHLWLCNVYKKKDGQPVSMITVVGRLCVLNKFFEYLKKKGYILIDPMFGYELPELGDPIPRDIMTKTEIKLMMDQPDIKTVSGYRDRTIMEVLYSTGLRNSELRNLRLNDLNIVNKELKVFKGKGGKSRIVPLNAFAVRFLKGYLNRIRPELVIDERINFVFLTENGMQMRSDHLQPLIKKYREQAGIKKQITAHSFRHTVATDLLNAGMNVRYIQAFLGHSSLKSTQVYTRIATNYLNKKYKEFHPRKSM